MKKLAFFLLVLLIGAAIWFFAFDQKKPTRPAQTEPNHHEVPSANTPKPGTIAQLPVTSSLPAPAKRPQFVLLSFDGSYDLSMWDETTAFAAKMRSEHKPLAFTYFISGVYFLPYRDRMQYHPPGQPDGKSTIGYADSVSDVNARVEKINQAVAAGHEIGTHFNGHFNGSTWTLAEWQSELAQFYDFVFAPGHDLDISAADIKGARTPLLGINQAYFDLMKEKHFLYDASMTGKATEWPRRTKEGVWELPLAQISYVPSGTSILSMDYNFYFKQTGGVDKYVRDTPEWNAAYYAMYDSYMKYFRDNYTGSRAPVIIGHHFSRWNDGVYWDALKQFAYDVCGQPDVECTTYANAATYLESL